MLVEQVLIPSASESSRRSDADRLTATTMSRPSPFQHAT
jgi:hypothetical protein